jgi:hypothetical protein
VQPEVKAQKKVQLRENTSLIYRQKAHNSKLMICKEKSLKVLECYTFLRVQRRHICFLVASFTNCVMTLYLLKVHLQTFLSIPITQQCQILNCDTLVAMNLMLFDNWVIWKFNLTASAVMDIIFFVNLKWEGYKRNEQQQLSTWE